MGRRSVAAVVAVVAAVTVVAAVAAFAGFGRLMILEWQRGGIALDMAAGRYTGRRPGFDCRSGRGVAVVSGGGGVGLGVGAGSVALCGRRSIATRRDALGGRGGAGAEALVDRPGRSSRAALLRAGGFWCGGFGGGVAAVPGRWGVCPLGCRSAGAGGRIGGVEVAALVLGRRVMVVLGGGVVYRWVSGCLPLSWPGA